MNLTELGFGLLPGLLIRSISNESAQTVDGPQMTGCTPVGTLRRPPPLPPEQTRAIDRRLSERRIHEAINDLLAIVVSRGVVRAPGYRNRRAARGTR